MACDLHDFGLAGGLVLAQDGPCQGDALRRFARCFHCRYLVRVSNYAVNTLTHCKRVPIEKTIATTGVCTPNGNNGCGRVTGKMVKVRT